DGAGPAGPSIQMTFSTADRTGFDDGSLFYLNTLFPMFGGTIHGQNLPDFAFNHDPTVAADHTAVTADEGQAAKNTGKFADVDGPAVHPTARVGRVPGTPAAAPWNWSLPPPDGPAAPVTVTVTANDGRGGQASTSFTYAVKDVAPTIGLTGDASASTITPYSLLLGSVTDPGTDTVSKYEVHWGDGTSTGVVTGSPVGLALQHDYASPGTRTITVDLYDEDGTHLAAGSKTITVSAPHDLGVSRTGRHAIVSGRVARFG